MGRWHSLGFEMAAVQAGLGVSGCGVAQRARLRILSCQIVVRDVGVGGQVGESWSQACTHKLNANGYRKRN